MEALGDSGVVLLDWGSMENIENDTKVKARETDWNQKGTKSEPKGEENA